MTALLFQTKDSAPGLLICRLLLWVAAAAPLTMVGAYAGISISDQLKEFAKQGWKMLLIAALVMIGTFTCSAIIAQIVLSMTHVI